MASCFIWLHSLLFSAAGSRSTACAGKCALGFRTCSIVWENSSCSGIFCSVLTQLLLCQNSAWHIISAPLKICWLSLLKKKKTENNKCWQGQREIRNLVHYWWECRLMQLLCEPVWKNLQNIKNRIIIWYSNPTSEYLAKRIENRILKRYLCTPVHCRVIHNSQEMEGTQCSWTNEWINKILHMFAMECYSTFKKRRTLSHVTTWMKPENIMLSKTCHVKRDMTWLHIYAVSKVVKYIECEYQGLGVGREGNGELLFSEYKVSVL